MSADGSAMIPLATARRAVVRLLRAMASNPDVKAFMESYQAFHEEYKVWGERGYLK